jgi:hypothetical protein
MNPPERPIARASKSRRLIWVAPGILLALAGCNSRGGDDTADGVAPAPTPAEAEAPATEPAATEAPTTEAPATEKTCVDGDVRIHGDDWLQCEDGEYVEYTPATTTEPPITTAAPTTTTTPPTTTTEAPVVPLIFDGSGNDVIDLGATITDPRIVRATFDGDSYLGVTALSDKLKETDQVVNDIGPTSGTYVLNLYDNEVARYLKVEVEGAWHIEVRDLTDARTWDHRKHVSGTGNDVLLYRNNGGILDYEFNTDSYTSVDLYGDDTENIVNDYNDGGLLEGTTAIPAGAGLVVIDTDGDWSMTIR